MVYSANISRITILHTTSALHAERKCMSFFEPSVLQHSSGLKDRYLSGIKCILTHLRRMY